MAEQFVCFGEKVRNCQYAYVINLRTIFKKKSNYRQAQANHQKIRYLKQCPF